MQLIERYNEAKTEQKLLRSQIKDKQTKLKHLEKSVKDTEKARWVLNEVIKQTQSHFKDQVEALVTTAIGTVFDRPFEFKLQFNEKPTKTEIQPIIKEGDNEYIPKLEMGGGIIELVSIAFRVVLWSMSDPQPRNVLILDEPCRMLGNLAERFGDFLTQISKELNLQIIMITHDVDIGKIADKEWSVTHDGTKSKVTVSGR